VQAMTSKQAHASAEPGDVLQEMKEGSTLSPPSRTIVPRSGWVAARSGLITAGTGPAHANPHPAMISPVACCTMNLFPTHSLHLPLTEPACLVEKSSQLDLGVHA
jgi:hypothetical protein